MFGRQVYQRYKADTPAFDIPVQQKNSQKNGFDMHEKCRKQQKIIKKAAQIIKQKRNIGDKTDDKLQKDLKQNKKYSILYLVLRRRSLGIK